MYSWVLTKSGKRFAFRRNEYVLRLPSFEGRLKEWKIQKKGQYLVLETIIGIIGIVVTVVSIIVTIISIRDNRKIHKHQKATALAKVRLLFCNPLT